jgi:hypothetical protein
MKSVDLEDNLLSAVGARPVDRDGVDSRVITYLKNRTGNYIHDINEVGGFPALAVNTRAFTTVENPHGTASTGYTNLETQLHNFAVEVEGGPVVPPEPIPPEPPSIPVNVLLLSVLGLLVVIVVGVAILVIREWAGPPPE